MANSGHSFVYSSFTLRGLRLPSCDFATPRDSGTRPPAFFSVRRRKSGKRKKKKQRPSQKRKEYVLCSLACIILLALQITKENFSQSSDPRGKLALLSPEVLPASVRIPRRSLSPSVVSDPNPSILHPTFIRIVGNTAVLWKSSDLSLFSFPSLVPLWEESVIMDPHAALELLEYLRTCYPIFLLLLFVVAFVANTMITASKANQNESQRMGPGGRPLPKRARSSPTFRKTKSFSKTVKRFFNWLSVAVLVTYLADATIYVVHVMVASSEHWWRGQSMVVRLAQRIFVQCTKDLGGSLLTVGIRFTSSAHFSSTPFY